jgi:hypothetical protein
MDSPERNGDAHIPGLIVIAYEDVHRAVSFVPPDWRVGAGANLERAPLNPVRLHDAREFPDDMRRVLEGWPQRRKTAQALALRSRIVLACAEQD